MGGFVWFGFRFVQRVLTLRCALIAVLTGKVNYYFLLFWGIARTAQLFARNDQYVESVQSVTSVVLPLLRVYWSPFCGLFTSFSGNCGAKFSKILKKFNTQDYADLKLARVPGLIGDEANQIENHEWTRINTNVVGRLIRSLPLAHLSGFPSNLRRPLRSFVSDANECGRTTDCTDITDWGECRKITKSV